MSDQYLLPGEFALLLLFWFGLPLLASFAIVGPLFVKRGLFHFALGALLLPWGCPLFLVSGLALVRCFFRLRSRAPWEFKTFSSPVIIGLFCHCRLS